MEFEDDDVGDMEEYKEDEIKISEQLQEFARASQTELKGNPVPAGSGALLGLKLLLQTIGDCVIVNSSGNITLAGEYVDRPFVHLGLNAAAAASGVSRSVETQVVAFAGDGATRSSLQSLIAAAERGDNFIYVCYNDQGYSNIGTLFKDETNFTSALEASASYVASASVSHPEDYIKKLKKAAELQGVRFINLLAPSPETWKFDVSDTVRIARLAVESVAWPLYEVKKGILSITYMPTRIEPIENYVELQKRFSLSEEEIEKMQKKLNRKWKFLLRRNK